MTRITKKYRNNIIPIMAISAVTLLSGCYNGVPANHPGVKKALGSFFTENKTADAIGKTFSVEKDTNGRKIYVRSQENKIIKGTNCTCLNFITDGLVDGQVHNDWKAQRTGEVLPMGRVLSKETKSICYNDKSGEVIIPEPLRPAFDEAELAGLIFGKKP